MNSTEDTIIALSTPPGVGALAVLRLSGTQSRGLTEFLLSKPIAWEPRRLFHVVLQEAGQWLDDVVVAWWQGPQSYTGEDVIEISCHGNPKIVQKLVASYLRRGARSALPGEFTQRAFLNGRMDLTRAEAVLDVIEAGSDYALRGAQAMQQGRLAEELEALRKELIQILAHLEAYIDFPEEDISPETGGLFQERVGRVRDRIRALRATATAGRILREGVLTAIVGAPNVGKSSLLNALLLEDRAIVSSTPGTTRDVIEAECRVGGIRLRLLDTAGQRITEDAVEAEGVRRAVAALERAQLVLHVVDGHVPPQPEPAGLLAERPGQIRIKIANKTDLGLHPEYQDVVALSVKTREGMEQLTEKIETALLGRKSLEDQGWLTVNARQDAALSNAEEALTAAVEGLRELRPPELVSVDLRSVLNALGDVTGLTTNEDILDQLFKNFCIGK